MEGGGEREKSDVPTGVGINLVAFPHPFVQVLRTLSSHYSPGEAVECTVVKRGSSRRCKGLVSLMGKPPSWPVEEGKGEGYLTSSATSGHKWCACNRG